MLAAVWAASPSVTSPSIATTLPKMATTDMSSSATPAVMLALRIDQLSSRKPRGEWPHVSCVLLYGRVLGAIGHRGSLQRGDLAYPRSRLPSRPVSTYDVRVRCTLHVQCTCVNGAATYGEDTWERQMAEVQARGQSPGPLGPEHSCCTPLSTSPTNAGSSRSACASSAKNSAAGRCRSTTTSPTRTTSSTA